MPAGVAVGVVIGVLTAVIAGLFINRWRLLEARSAGRAVRLQTKVSMGCLAVAAIAAAALLVVR